MQNWRIKFHINPKISKQSEAMRPSENVISSPRPEAGNTNWGCLGRLENPSLMLMGTNGSFSFCFHFRLFSWCAHKLNLCFVRGRIGTEIQAKMNIIFRPWPDRRRFGEEKKQISPYRRGMRFLMLLRYRGGQPPSHHTVVTSDVRNSFLPEMPKVHAIWHLSVSYTHLTLPTICSV